MNDSERQAAIDRIIADPEAFHLETLAKLRQERGEPWVEEHTDEIEAGWQAVKAQFGL